MNIQGKMIFDKETHLYSVSVPLLGLWTQGENFEEGFLMAEDGLKMLYPDIAFELHWLEKEVGTFFVSSGDKKLVSIILKEARLASEMSLMEVAKKLGYKNQNSIYAYESGAREPSIGKFQELLSAYGVSIDMHKEVA